MNASEITPFRIQIPDDDIADLRERLRAARQPEQLPAARASGASDPATDWSRGVPQHWLGGLTDYWRDGFDWRGVEAVLNRLPQFTTEVNGQTIHFVHTRSSNPDATPLLLTHGWPGSFLELVGLIPVLTEPQDYGGDARDAFHVVIPSVPGFAFSTPLADGGWDDTRIASAFAELMSRLGYERFGTQGGDFGAAIAPEIARVAPDRVVGVHVNGTTGTMPDLPLSEAELADLSARERRAIADIEAFMWGQFGYISIQSTRPGLIGTLLTDGPQAQLAWIMDKIPGVDLACRAGRSDDHRSRPAARQRVPVLVHPVGRLFGADRLRAGRRLGRSEAGLRSSDSGHQLRPRHRHPPLRRDGELRRAVDGRRSWRALRRTRRTRAARRRHPGLLPRAPEYLSGMMHVGRTHDAGSAGDVVE
jgi:pimeloyl-ACP methyl ester carboxylesterase